MVRRSDKDYKPVPCIFRVTWLAAPVEKSRARSSLCRRLSLVSSYYFMHGLDGWVGDIKYGLIAAVRGAFTS